MLSRSQSDYSFKVHVDVRCEVVSYEVYFWYLARYWWRQEIYLGSLFIYFALMFNVIYIWLQLTTAVQVKGMFSYLYLASIL